MKRLILLLVLCFLFPACREDKNRHAVDRFDGRDEVNTTAYPLFIDGGAKMVYQFGHLTADKGLKLYFDTIPHPAGGLHLYDSVRRRLSVRE